MGSFTETSGELELNPGGHLSSWQQFILVLSRFCVGWHLFYQGLGKFQKAHWSAKGYLKSATGPMSSQFSKLAANAAWLTLADRATIWGLMIVGMLLMIGLFARWASVRNPSPVAFLSGTSSLSRSWVRSAHDQWIRALHQSSVDRDPRHCRLPGLQNGADFRPGYGGA